MKRVKVIYRNYIPLYTTYLSFGAFPKEFKIIIPPVKSYLRKFYPIYKKFGNNPIISKVVGVAQKVLFSSQGEKNDADILFYVGMIPEKIPSVPFVIDLEHPHVLLNAVKPSEEKKREILKVFMNKKCIGITPTSSAAERTLKKYFGKYYGKFSKKVKTILPALPSYVKKYKGQEDYTYFKKNDKKLRFLFVGKEGHRKGLSEVLAAFDVLSQKYRNIELVVLTDKPQEFNKKYKNNKQIKFFISNFSHHDVVTKFYLHSDVFVMPTHADTLGIVFMEALSIGLPVVTTRQFATPEIVTNNKNGLFVDSPKLFFDKEVITKARVDKDFTLPRAKEERIVKDLIKKLEYLIKNPKEIVRMSRNAVKDFQRGGRFSFEKRNSELLKLFKKAS